MRWLLGMSLGYSRLQLAVGRGDGTPFRSVHREPIDPNLDAAALQLQVAAQIERFLNRSGLKKADIAGVGCGFRGPVDPANGIVRGGPHSRGWDQFPLAHWLTVNFNWPATVFQDTEAAAIAEASAGAGRGFSPFLYVHAGSQICGAVILSGKDPASAQPYRGLGPAADIGYLRPGNGPRNVSYPATTVNALASEVGLVQRATRVIEEWEKTREVVEETFAHPATPVSATAAQSAAIASKQRDTAALAVSDRFGILLRLAGPDRKRLNAETIAQAATQGDRLSRELLADAATVLGWGIAQAITLFHPARVIIGGGLSRLNQDLFFEPLRRACRSEVSPQLTAWRGPADPAAGGATRIPTHDIISGSFGDAAALHGALLIAKRTLAPDPGLRAFSPEA